ncbi:phosphoadenylyl-sulfate reductase [Phytoactinopolyspora mesophila]|uniref:Adenosine 5'-phosphosulfate reductase n=1 Tax=Phytoactinopolyspora mesophila TaxID=2650750 RepID=A0A7K3MCP7_9ACTN|nr:phosphoadenylyl-sulfate reductase [Phytoactinopolyspora mesophila]NDL61095.1 phosphoadenylyl-sulfate reductase [Phytoactinopolyspora mesophila]
MSHMTNAELQDIAESARTQLESADATEIVKWAHETFGTRLVITASMADGVLCHLVSQIAPGLRVVFLDTGYHFAETIGTRDAIAAEYRIVVDSVHHPLSVADHEASHGSLYETNPDLCCFMRKVLPLDLALRPYQAWASGVRRSESATRAQTPVIDWDSRRHMVKINPLAYWTDDQVNSYIKEHGIIENPLRQLGYTSIGCAPCTQPIQEGADIRSGRWAGHSKTECGLHEH